MNKEDKKITTSEEKDEHGNGLSIGMCLGVAVGTGHFNCSRVVVNRMVVC